MDLTKLLREGIYIQMDDGFSADLTYFHSYLKSLGVDLFLQSPSTSLYQIKSAHSIHWTFRQGIYSLSLSID